MSDAPTISIPPHATTQQPPPPQPQPPQQQQQPPGPPGGAPLPPPPTNGSDGPEAAEARKAHIESMKRRDVAVISFGESFVLYRAVLSTFTSPAGPPTGLRRVLAILLACLVSGTFILRVLLRQNAAALLLDIDLSLREARRYSTLTAQQVRQLHSVSHWNTQALEVLVYLLDGLVLSWWLAHSSYAGILYTALPATIPLILGLGIFAVRELRVRRVARDAPDP